jgi:hypothetical protein
MATCSVMRSLSAVALDLLGQPIIEKKAQPKIEPVIAVVRKENITVPFRPYEVTRINNTTVMLVNSDCAHYLA